MKTVYVVKNLDCGWDDVVGVFIDVNVDDLELRFNHLDNYVILESTLYDSTEMFGEDYA